MEQPDSAPYVPSPYPNMMDLPSSLPLRTASNEPTRPDSRQHSFDKSSPFSTVSLEKLQIPESRVADSLIDPWLVDMPGTASPESSRLSMSPSQGIATPSSDGFYPPPYLEQLRLPATQLLEQPQPVQSCAISHPNWASSAENWEHTYADSDLWGNQPFVAQPWIPNAYDGYVPPNAHHNLAYSINNAPLFAFSAQSAMPLPEPVQTRGATGSPSAEDNEDGISSDEESDWDDDESDCSQSGSSPTKSKPKEKAPGISRDRWMIPTPVFPTDVRAYACNMTGCPQAFGRPEHLRRHVRSKHTDVKDYRCIVPGCSISFSRSDNLRDHYWTHLHRGGRAGKNKKYTLQELKGLLGPKERKLIRKLKRKLQQHLAKEKLKKEQRAARPTYTARPML